jgi:hypothetical protein
MPTTAEIDGATPADGVDTITELATSSFEYASRHFARSSAFGLNI